MTIGNNLAARFDKKLDMLIEKYGRKPNLSYSGNDDKEKKEDILEIENNYYFHYEKVKNIAKEQLDIDLTKQNGKYLYTLIFYDEETKTCFSEINSDSDLKDNPSTMSLENFHYSINDLRIRYKEEKYQNESVKRLVDFAEELFEDKYKKMQEMIDNNSIDFESLWYYFDKVETLYKAKYLDEDICFKYTGFYYENTVGQGKILNLCGDIICPKKGELVVCAFDHEIASFVGKKSLESFNLNKIEIEDNDLFLKNGLKIFNLYKNMEHMHLKGKQYYKSGQNIIYCEKDERVMLDYEGMEKFGNIPYCFYTEKNLKEEEIKNDQSLLKIIFPFASIYNLGMNKMWGITSVENLEEVIYKQNAFDYLVLDETKKLIIKSLITNIDNTQYSDFIGGKGEGLVFLLYGMPGTGKTLTVEATCEYLKRPLFTLNIGDFGTDPSDMELIFDKELNLARRWNAIVLIDEVDIFIEERESGSIVTNGMVCIFLRLLEYLKGIIFLTTNRLNSIDSAIKSRIDLMISYQKLNRASRNKIWASLLNNLKIDVDKQTLEKLSQFDLNGREIRNYMKIVLAIHQERKKTLTNDSIVKVLQDCVDLSTEFNKTILNQKEGSIYL